MWSTGASTSTWFCRRFVTAACLASLITAAASTRATAADTRGWLANPTLDRDSLGWRVRMRPGADAGGRWQPRGGRHGSGGMVLNSSSRDTTRDYLSGPVLGTGLSEYPVGRHARFLAWVRGKDCVFEPILVARATAADRTILASGTTEGRTGLRGTFDWTAIECSLDIPAATARLELMVAMIGGGEIAVDDLSLTDEGPAAASAPSPRGSGVILAIEHAAGVGAGPAPPGAFGTSLKVRVQLPLPRSDELQVPLDLDLWTEPRTALASASLRTTAAGNPVAELDLLVPYARGAGIVARSARDGVIVRWRSHVLVPAIPARLGPGAAAIPAEWPVAARPWLRATASAQADDPAVAEAARELREGTHDVVEIVNRTLAFVAELAGRVSGRARSFDAVSALAHSGSCVSNANLAVALLRANGIPARQLCGYSTFAGPHDLHVLVEAWVPGYGWYRIDPSRQLAGVAPADEVIACIVEPAAEDSGARRRPGVVPGLAWLGAMEFAGACPGCRQWGALDPERDANARVTRFRGFGDGLSPERWQVVMHAARSRWERWFGSTPALDRERHLRAPFDGRQAERDLAP